MAIQASGQQISKRFLKESDASLAALLFVFSPAVTLVVSSVALREIAATMSTHLRGRIVIYPLLLRATD